MNGDTKSVRCEATVTRRNREGEPHRQGERCKHITTRGIYCWQHEKQIRHFRITKTNAPPQKRYGLITALRIPKGRLICRYDGKKLVTNDPDVGNPFLLKISNKTYIDAYSANTKQEGRWIKISNHPNSELVVQNGKAYIYATKDIEPKSEILCDYRLPNKPRKQIEKPRQSRQPKIPRAPRQPRQPKVVLTRQQKLDRKFQRSAIIRLQYIAKLFGNKAFGEKLRLKYQPVRYTFKIPKQGDRDVVDYNNLLGKLTTKQEKALLAYLQTTSGSNTATLLKVKQLLDKLIAKHKPEMQPL